MSNRTAPTSEWLAGGGETGELIRSMEWADTPLGPRHGWPSALRTTVGLVVESRVPMALLWGPELILVYNDAYRIICADRHPRAMGRPTREIWPEVWHINEPIFGAVLERGETIYLEDKLFPIERRGRMEDAYFTLCYSPVRGDDGRVAGSLVTLLETTTRVRERDDLVVALREKEERLRVALESLRQSAAILAQAGQMANLGAWSVDLASDDVNANPLYWSDHAYRIFGYEPGQVHVTNGLFFQHVHPDDRARVADAVTQALAERRPYEIEHRIIRPDGSERIVREHAVIAFDGQSRARQIVGAVQDITEHNRMEAALRESAARHQALIEASSQVLYRMSADWSEMLALKGGDFLVDTAAPNPGWLNEYIHPDDQAMVQEAISQAVRTASVFELEHRVVKRDGRLGWTASRAVPVRGATGEVIEWFGAASDITRRKESERALRESEQRLRAELEAAECLRDVSTRLVSGGNAQELYEHLLDGAMRLMRADFASIQMLEEQDSAGGGTLRLLAWRGFHPQSARFWQSLELDHSSSCAAARRSGERLIIEDTEQSDLVAKTTDLVEYRRSGIRSMQSTPLVSRSGRLVGVISTHWREPWRPSEDDLKLFDVLARQAADLIERRQAEDALNAANRQLLEADRRKDEFIAILSHELRNPLAPIRYALPVLQREGLTQPAGRAVQVIDRQLGYLTRLVDDLLDVSRISRDKIELRKEYVTLDPIINSAIEAASPMITAARHDLELAVADEPIWLHVDAARLSQIVTNLLNNSAKYTPRGGRIVLAAGRENNDAVIRVRDTGIGIPREEVPTIFEMFRQVNAPGWRAGDPARPDTSQGGLGIGLALVKRFVEMHGGTIEAHSDGVGRGAEFVVRLPVARPHRQGDPPQSEAAVASAATRLKVLVVDDNADLVEMLAMLVEAAGHDVRKALDGRSAVSAALSYRPDVVLLDLGLPIMSGLEVARELRRRPEMARARLVALTGWGQAEDRRQTEKAGFDDHLTKPADPRQLQRLLAKVASTTRG